LGSCIVNVCQLQVKHYTVMVSIVECNLLIKLNIILMSKHMFVRILSVFRCEELTLEVCQSILVKSSGITLMQRALFRFKKIKYGDKHAKAYSLINKERK
jgi:hypothetical protein